MTTDRNLSTLDMKKNPIDNTPWEKIFPELEIQESITVNNLENPGVTDTLQITDVVGAHTLANLGDYDFPGLGPSSLPSLTTSDLYTIDFANIGNITTINLSAVTTGSSAIWNSAGSWNNPISASVNINSNGTIEIPEGGDLKIGNVSLTDRLDRIESHLGILRPSPELEKEFAELKALGEQYRALEQDIRERLKTFETLRRE